MTNSTDTRGGMSRAAKKRAKKKQKRRRRPNEDDPNDDDDDDDHQNAAAVVTSNNNNKKPRTAHDDDDDDDDDDEVPTASATVKKVHAEEKKKKKKPRNDKEQQPQQQDPLLLDEAHNSSDDDDEEMEMKVPAAAAIATIDTDSYDAVVGAEQLPPSCPRLRDILLLDDNHDGNNSNNSSHHFFHSLTSRQRARCALQFLLQTTASATTANGNNSSSNGGVSVSHFYEHYWEKKPLHVVAAAAAASSLQQQHRFDGFLSLQSLRQITSSNKSKNSKNNKNKKKSPPLLLYYGKDLNVTRYEVQADGVARRVTLDPVVAAAKKTQTNDDDNNSSSDEDHSFVPVTNPADLWDQFDRRGCTIRFLCPHRLSPALHALLSLLDLEWGCMVGCNAYLTPPNAAQGFAPHYDDIEAFVLQLEGRKRWKVYPPVHADSTLPRVSSEDYTAADVAHFGEPVLDVTLGPGDLLYMPRGWIHQACTLKEGDDSIVNNNNNNNIPDRHSLHLTISCQQQWAWADLLEVVVPEALETSIASHVSLREGLPRNFLDYMGVQHDNYRNVPEVLRQSQENGGGETAASANNSSSNGDTPDDQEKLKLQQAFRDAAKKRIMRVAKTAMDMLDAACDQMGTRFLSDRLPPALTPDERASTGQPTAATTTTMQTAPSQPEEVQTKIQPQDLVRLVRPGIARLILEDNDKAVLYHCADNSVVYREHALQPMEFELDDGPALEQLLTCVEPHWVCVADLLHDTLQDKVAVAQALYDEGILALRRT